MVDLTTEWWARALGRRTGVSSGARPAKHLVVLCIAAALSGLTACVIIPNARHDSSGDSTVMRTRERGQQLLACDVIIIGGGAGGVHTAFRLGQRGGRSVCLFEREAYLGGRIFDVSLNETGESPRFGVGARRVEPQQPVLLSLAKELGITYEICPYRDDLILARGKHSVSTDGLARLAYPTLTSFDKSRKNESEVADALYAKLQVRKDLEKYPDFPSYVRATIGSEGYHYLLDVSRFRGDFAYPLDAKGYMDWLDEESKLDTSRAAYPVGGMSEFIRRMAHAAEAAGVRIFVSEPVVSLNQAGSLYEAMTRSYRVRARQVIIAVDADALRFIGGDIVEEIRATPQYRQLIGVKVATVTQWWPDAWWLRAYPGRDIRRVWTTDQCVNFMEMPVDSYGGSLFVTRTVYSDDMSCVEMWEQLRATSVAAVEAQIARELHEIFPTIEVPRPLKTHVQVWPNAWYWQRAGSRFSNVDIAEWAVKPIARAGLSLVGESYYPQRATWSDAAYKSSMEALDAQFGIRVAVQNNERGNECEKARLSGCMLCGKHERRGSGEESNGRLNRAESLPALLPRAGTERARHSLR
jgi:glycine/D-amino acid oxidase-like deaminating enzyme